MGEIAKTYSGGTPSIANKKFYIDGHIPFIKSGEIGSTRTEQKINYDGLNNSSARLIETGTLLYALYGATSGKAAISPIDGAINQAVLAIIPQNNVNRFIYEWLNKNKSKITGKYLQGGQGNLSAKIIKQINIYISSKNEELKISNILRIVNKIISLQQRKLSRLKEFKNTILSEVLRVTNQKYPSLRLINYKNNWKYKELGNIGQFKSGTSLEKQFISKGELKVINIGSYSEDHTYFDQNIRAKLNDITSKYLLNKNDLTMILNDKTTTGKIIGSVLLIPKNNSYIYNQRTERIIVDNTKYSPMFLYYFLNADNIRHEIVRRMQGGTQVYINIPTVKKIRYYFPELQEQNKLSNMLDKINHFIIKQEKMISSLNQLKQFLLQNMFI